MIVSLTIDDIYHAILLGRARQAAKHDLWKDNDSGFHRTISDRAYPHILGVIAEMAYAKLSGQPLNKDIYVTGDAKPDFGSVEIKATTYAGPSPKLIVGQRDLDKAVVAETFVLGRIHKSYRSVDFLGQISLTDFLAKRKPYERANFWYVNGTDLQPLALEYHEDCTTEP